MCDVLSALTTIGKANLAYFKQLYYQGGATAVLAALETPPPNLSTMCGAIHWFLNRDLPTSSAQRAPRASQALQAELHPALLDLVVPVQTPGDGSCL